MQGRMGDTESLRFAYMNGQLHDHPLAELIREISAERLSGVLRLVRERAKGVVYFDAGRIVSARSNLRAFRLAECLRRWRVVSAERLASIVTETMPDAEAAAALVAAGAIDETGLEIVRERQGAETLHPMLLWTDGEWSFDPRTRLDETTHAPLESLRLLLEGARRLPVEFVAARLADDEMMSPAAAAPAGAQLLPVEAFVLSRVDAPMRVGEVVAVSGVPESQTRQALYVLALVGLLRRGRWSRIFSPEAVAHELKRKTGAPSHAVVTPKPVAAKQAPTVVNHVEPEATAPIEADPLDELDALFALATVTNYYEMFAVGRNATADDIKRAYYTLAKRFHPDRFHRDADDALRARVEQSFGKIAQAYETLKDSSLRATYDLKLDAQLRRAASSAPAPQPPLERTTTPSTPGSTPKPPTPQKHTSQQQATQQPPPSQQATPRTPPPQATSTRTPPQTTSTPPDASGTTTDAAPLYRAEQSFQQALWALKHDNQVLALSCLSEAVRLAPQQARYRAHYGRALATDPRARRAAETELQAAVALDARNASYCIMLAEFYRDNGLRRRAESELERALSVDPQHAAARTMLNALRTSGARD